MNAKFFKLFGTRIDIPGDEESDAGPSHVPDSDPAPHDLSPDHSGALVLVDAPMNTTTGYDDADHYGYPSDQGSSSDVVLNPEPLRYYNPCHEYFMHAASSSTTVPKPKRKYQKRKPDDNLERVRPIRRRRRAPLQPLNDLSPDFLEMITPARPFFLYRKHLELTDVDKHQNRLLVTDTDRLREFLTKEEMAKPRVKVIAFDAGGKDYKFTLSKWGEKDVRKKKKSVVFNTGWFKMVSANEVKVYEYVDLWGFRRGPTNEFCLAVAFSKIA